MQLTLVLIFSTKGRKNKEQLKVSPKEMLRVSPCFYFYEILGDLGTIEGSLLTEASFFIL